MYHYLKWAALSLFFRRNVAALLWIAVGIAGIYAADALYRDLADWATRIHRTERIALFLTMKWIAVLLCLLMIVRGIFRLGIRGENRGKERDQKAKATQKKQRQEPWGEDPYLRRMERFRHGRPLRKRSDLLLEREQKKRRIQSGSKGREIDPR